MRADLAAVLLRFDLGNTVLAPIRITLPHGAGVRDDFRVLSVPNLKDMVDPALSLPMKRGRKRWGHLHTDDAVDATIVARRSALEGPDIWTDRLVSTTIFVSDRLAEAILAEDWGAQVLLRRVRLADPEDGDAGTDR